MSISNRFHLLISTTTVAFGYWMVTHLTIAATDVPAWLTPHLKSFSAYLGSVAFYQLMATALRWCFGHSRWLRKTVFGSEYLEGTWIGAYMVAGVKSLTVEHYEQTIDGIVVRGFAFTEQDVPHAVWMSQTVSFDASSGKLIYSYNCDLFTSKTSYQGIAIFMIERDSVTKGATTMIGYSADLIDGTRVSNHEYKLSDRQIGVTEALKAAKKRF